MSMIGRFMPIHNPDGEAPVTVDQPCGHPARAVYTGGEGTSHCVACVQDHRDAEHEVIEAATALCLDPSFLTKLKRARGSMKEIRLEKAVRRLGESNRRPQ